MEFWLVKDGEKEGPLLDFELRSRIRAGDVPPEQKVWFSELDEWVAIGEVDFFAEEFKAKVVDEENVDEYLASVEEELSTQPEVRLPQPQRSEIHLWRRFGARWFDYLAYISIILSWVALAGFNWEGLRQNQLFVVLLVLPWIFLEAMALHFWGTTPGKWLTGLKVTGSDGHRLSPGAALVRTVQVMILGMGFLQPVLRELCHLVSLWFAVKRKVVLWDVPSGIRLERIEESSIKWIVFGIGMIVFLSVLMIACVHILLTQSTPEQLKELGLPLLSPPEE